MGRGCRDGDHASRRGRLVVATYLINQEAIRILRLGVVETLTTADYAFGPARPHLAERWEDLGGGLWRFHLRPGVTMHDGRPFDAAVAAACTQRFLETGEGSALRAVLAVEAEGPLTLEVQARPAASPVPAYFGWIPMMAPESFLEGDRLGVPIGTGPFRVERIEYGREALLRAHDAWWGGPPALREILVRQIDDPSTRVLMLESGDADWIQMPPRHEIPRLSEAGFAVLRADYLYNVYLLFNVESGPGAESAVRQAAAWAVDRERIVRVAFEGKAEPAGTIFPEPVPPPEIPRYGLHRDRAREILAAAGWRPAPGSPYLVRDGRGLSLTILTAAETLRPEWPAVAELVRQDLEAIGIRTQVRVLETAAWNADVAAGRFEATIRGRVPSLWSDPLIILSLDFASRGFKNVTRYRDPRFDEALARGLAAEDHGERAEAVAGVQRLLAEELPVVPLCRDTWREVFAVDPRVRWDPGSLRTGFPGPGTCFEEDRP